MTDTPPTPPTPLQLLLEVQEHDTAVDQLTHRREHLPERTALAEHEAAVAEVLAVREAQEQRVGELGRSLKRLQDEVASLEQRVAEVGRLMHSGAVTVPRELQALQHEQESLRRRQDHLETEELEIMEELDPLNEEVAAGGERLAAMAADGEKLAQALADAEAGVEEELTRLVDERAAVAASVPAELLETYAGLRQRLGGVAVARLAGGVCGGCHLGLSAVEVDRIKRQPPDALVHCEECGRLLVR